MLKQEFGIYQQMQNTCGRIQVLEVEVETLKEGYGVGVVGRIAALEQAVEDVRDRCSSGVDGVGQPVIGHADVDDNVILKTAVVNAAVGKTDVEQTDFEKTDIDQTVIDQTVTDQVYVNPIENSQEKEIASNIKSIEFQSKIICNSFLL